MLMNEVITRETLSSRSQYEAIVEFLPKHTKLPKTRIFPPIITLLTVLVMGVRPRALSPFASFVLRVFFVAGQKKVEESV